MDNTIQNNYHSKDIYMNIGKAYKIGLNNDLKYNGYYSTCFLDHNPAYARGCYMIFTPSSHYNKFVQFNFECNICDTNSVKANPVWLDWLNGEYNPDPIFHEENKNARWVIRFRIIALNRYTS